MGYAPAWTGLLLTASDGQVCHEERVEQTRSTDTTVKNLTWLLFYVPPDLELQPGRVNAACRRIHRMLKLRHCCIDDDDEGLGDDDHASSRGGVQDGGGEFGAAKLLEFGVFFGTARVLLRLVPRGSQPGWRCDVFLGPCVRHRGGGEEAPTPGVSPRCWAPCQLVQAFVAIHILSEREHKNNHNNHNNLRSHFGSSHFGSRLGTVA